jgi:hypothetical protein
MGSKNPPHSHNNGERWNMRPSFLFSDWQRPAPQKAKNIFYVHRIKVATSCSCYSRNLKRR